jgi:hypothetical protein
MAKSNLTPSLVKRYTTIAELEKQPRGQVYVLNSTRGAIKGQLLINIPKQNGNGSTLIRIPDTFIPLDLTSQVTRRDLLESSEFRNTVTKGLLKLLNPVYAEALLETRDAKAELKRIQNEMERARAALQNATLSDAVDREEEEEIDEEDEVDLSTLKSAKAAKEGSTRDLNTPLTVSAKIKHIVSSSVADDLSQEDIIAKIRKHGVLDKDELIYLAGQFKNQPRVIKHLRSVREEMSESTRG